MIIDAIFLGICAWVFVMRLMGEGMIMGWWWNVIKWLPEWLSEPLGGCEYCVAGQMALWYYIYKYEYNLVEHIIFICLTIFTVEIINTWKRSE